MTIIIYALRVRGELEARYVGQSADPQKRLQGHLGMARNMPWATNFANWLIENRNEIEAVELARAPTRAEARSVERSMVAVCLALNHRLFNQWLVPALMRQPARDDSPAPLWLAA